MYRRITRMRSGAARRRIVDPIDAASEKGLGDIYNNYSNKLQNNDRPGCNYCPSLWTN